MKKSVVILIGLIYAASIVLVSFFGLQYKQFNEIVYVSSVEIINAPDKTAVDKETGEEIKTYFVYKDEATGLRTFQIEWRVEPIETVTNKNVKFIYTEDPRFSVSETGLVTFYEGGVVANIQIVPEDGSDCSDTIKIYCLN